MATQKTDSDASNTLLRRKKRLFLKRESMTFVSCKSKFICFDNEEKRIIRGLVASKHKGFVGSLLLKEAFIVDKICNGDHENISAIALLLDWLSENMKRPSAPRKQAANSVLHKLGVMFYAGSLPGKEVHIKSVAFSQLNPYDKRQIRKLNTNHSKTNWPCFVAKQFQTWTGEQP